MPEHYLAVADVESGDALFIEQFLTGYSSLQDVYYAYETGTLDDIGIDPATFDFLENQKSVMTELASFSASNWMNESLFTEFWMKNYDEVQGHGHYDLIGQKEETNLLWLRTKKAMMDPDSLPHVSDNTIDCMQAVMDAWSYGEVMDIWNDSSYRWGLTHGDFHPGQVMANTDNLDDMVIADFEFAGVMGNPAVDLVTWMSTNPNEFMVDHEDDLILQYWKGLIQAGVDGDDYPFEQLSQDYKILGSAHLVARIMFLGGWAPRQPTLQYNFTLLEEFFTRHNLTPDQMVAPCYLGMDIFV